MQKIKKILLIIAITITLFIIPNAFVLNNGFFVNNRKSEVINPKESFVYIEDVGDSTSSIDVDGDYAYLGTSLGLAVVNITNPTDPEFIIIRNTTDPTTEVEYVSISGNYAYVTDENYLFIIDISDPSNPGTPVTLEFSFDMVRSVSVSGNYAYVGGDDWLHVVDISTPTSPSEVASEAVNGAFSQDIYISGNYAYIAVWDEGLAIVDISNPLNPGTPVYEDTDGRAYGVSVSGDCAYVADGDSGLAVINVSTPTNPGAPVYRDTDGFALDIFVEGNYAYLADRETSLAVIDISDPTNPGPPAYKVIGSDYSRDIFIRNDYAYLAGTYGLAVVDLTDITDPIITDSPNDFLIEAGYSGVNISWTATDLNPDTYTIALQGTGIVEGPTAWLNGTAITYNVPDDLTVPAGLSYYEFTYTVNFSDDYDNFVTDSVIITLQNTSTSAFWAYLTEGAVDSSPALGDVDEDDKLEVIIGSDDGNVYALNGEDGTKLWNYSTADVIFSSPALGDIDADGRLEVVVGSDDDFVYALNGESGTEAWKYDTNGRTHSSPAIADVDGDGKPEVVFGQMFDGDIVVLNGENGGFLWSYPTGYMVSSSPAIGDIDEDGKLEVVIASQDGNLYAVNGEDGSLNWSYTLSWYITASPSIADLDGDGKLEVIIGTEWGGDRGVYAINGKYGTHMWNFTVGNEFQCCPAIGDVDEDGNNEVIVGCFDGKVYAINGEDGSEAWNSTIGSQIFSSPSLGDVDGDGKLEVVIGSDNGYLYALNGEDGSMVWNFSAQNNIDSSPVLGDLDDDGKLEVVVGSADRAVYAYKPTLSGEKVVWQGLAGKDFLRTRAEDLTVPIITDTPSDFSVEYGYTGVSISWTAVDLHPNTYTIELQGTGIVEGPTAWSSDVAITYNVPDGFGLGDFIYIVNFSDDDGNFATDSVTLTVEDTTDPSIIDAPSDFSVEYGYTGENISWTATDPHPNTYTIELQGTGIVAGPTAWSSGVAITYYVPDGFGLGDYIYTVNFTDNEGQFVTDSVTLTVEDTTDPIITVAPSDFSVEYGYTGENISWTATDPHPNTYTIELQGTGIVAGPTAWSSGVAITYYVPDGFGLGDYIYTVNFTDNEGNFVTDSVTMAVGDSTDPIITVAPSDFSAEYGYTGVSISWTATDLNPNTYTIELQGFGTVAGPIAWSNGVAITYNVPDGFGLGDYVYTVNFTDDYGNFMTDSVTLVVEDTTAPLITDAPSDFSVNEDYTGVSLSWTATDPHPNTYTIELQGSGIVIGPTSWSSGVPIIYIVPDGLAAGEYIYIITFRDDDNNFRTDSVTMTVGKVSAGEQAIPFGNYYLIFLVIGIISLVIVQKRRKQFSST